MRFLKGKAAVSIIICMVTANASIIGVDAASGNLSNGYPGFGSGIYMALATILYGPVAFAQPDPSASGSDWTVKAGEPESPSGSPEPAGPAEPVDPVSLYRIRQDDKITPLINVSCFRSEKISRYIAYRREYPGLSCEEVVTCVNIGLDKPFYSEVSVAPDPDSITVLVNKYNRLPDGYVPTLERIDPACCVPGKGGQALRPEAKQAFERMYYDAKGIGLNIPVYGSYRSIPAQAYIWNREIKEGKTPDEVDYYHARAGYSEHNTGLALDVVGTGYGLSETKEYLWYQENAHKYGFIIRYQQGMESMTGYKYEPWHLRYVGVDTATAVYESGLSYDEYYVRHLSGLPK